MKVENTFPQTLIDAIAYFGNETNAFNFMVELRWPNGVCCPRCQSKHIGFISTRRMWECHDCKTKKQFTLKVGTIFEDSALPLAKWLAAIWMIANDKNGVSSYEVARAIGVTQKTAWFMLHRIRLAMQTGSFAKMSGEVEADETFIGGRLSLMNSKQRKGRDWGHEHMVPVAGLLQRSAPDKPSRVKLQALDGVARGHLFPHILQNVERGAKIYTDAFRSYRGLSMAYSHEVVDHAVAYVQGKVHTNGLENFWNLLKRTIRGTYVSVDPVHLQRYLDEQAFRFNERKDNDAGRFLKAARGIIGKTLRYLELTNGKGGEDLPPQTARAW
jgi:transposase-like protein